LLVRYETVTWTVRSEEPVDTVHDSVMPAAVRGPPVAKLAEVHRGVVE
jgi:hypothetical protein